MPNVEVLLIAFLAISAVGIVVGTVGGIRLVTSSRSGTASRTSLATAVSGFGVALVLMVVALIIGMAHLLVIATAA